MSYVRNAGITAVFALVFMAAGCGSSPFGSNRPVFNKPNNPEEIIKLMKPEAAAVPQEGIAAAILLDTSGSMSETVMGSDNRPSPKIGVAQKSLLSLVGQFRDFAQKHPEKKLLVGIYDFSSRTNLPSCRQVVKMGPPDFAVAQTAIKSITAAGGTPIGDAMIMAKRDLAATGLSRRHILVITDGENNRGYVPGDVARAIGMEPETDRAAIYFIAFDVGAEVFDPVKEAGGLVLAAESEPQLTRTLDYILTGKILVEQPPEPPRSPHPAIKK